MIDYGKVARAVEAGGSPTIVVFGDYCLDKYLYTDPANDELSVETGLVAYQFDRKALFAGVGGTITNNLRALEANVRCVGMLGRDGEGFELRQALEQVGADPSYMVETPGRCTYTYTIPMRKNPDGSYSEMNRLDFRSMEPLPPELEDALVARLEQALEGADAVIVTDQFVEPGLGALTDRVREAVCNLALEHPDIVFYADSRAFVEKYRNLVVKCNDHELLRVFDPAHEDSPTRELVEQYGQQLTQLTGRPAYVTLGAAGSMLFAQGQPPVAAPAFQVEGPIDIVGAGDATNAGIVLGLCLGLAPQEAAALGNCVSSITIQQIGRTGTATRQQVAQRLRTRA